ncbi:MAG: phosphoribosyltransferase family protein [Planctomycetia bacterium]|nr:phosphoribosyltransferase family protein [Planctomycetia bacterium]
MQSESVTLGDKTFEPYLSADVIQEAVMRLAERMNRELAGENPLFVCVLKGALPFYADLTRRCTLPLEMAFLQASSYFGTEPGDTVSIQAIAASVAGRTVVLVDDVQDSGRTMDTLREYFQKRGARRVLAAVMFAKPERFQGQTPAEYVGMEIGPEFIVGYGLDYRELGRNLPDLYRLREP